MSKDRGFVNVRIKESDHHELTKYVTHDIKLHDVITMAVDALRRVNNKK